MDGLDSKDIFLKKDGAIVGLHSVGYTIPYTYTLHHFDGSVEEITTDFMPMESWGNEYNDQFEMIGRGSFRLGTSFIEDEAKLFEQDGWVRFTRP